MKISQLSVDDAYLSLSSEADGLSESEAARRLEEYGPNEIEGVRRKPWAARLASEFAHFFAIILWVGAGLAFFAEAHDPGQGMATLGWAIIGVILINGLFSFAQAYRAERAMEALQRLLPNMARVRRQGRQRVLSAKELVPGDVILLEAGDRVPADVG